MSLILRKYLIFSVMERDGFKCIPDLRPQVLLQILPCIQINTEPPGSLCAY